MVRHPGYSAGFLIVGARGIALGSWLAAAFLAVVVLPFVFYRVLNEDRVLQGRLDGYADHAVVCHGAQRGSRPASDSHKRYYGTIIIKSGVSSFGERQRHAVERGRHMIRELGAQYLVVEVGVEVGQHGAPRLHTFDPAQRVLD